MTQNNSNSFTLQFPSAEYLTNRIINWGYNNTPEAVSEYVNEQLANFEKKMKEKAINVQFILNEMKMVNLQRDQYRVIDAILCTPASIHLEKHLHFTVQVSGSANIMGRFRHFDVFTFALQCRHVFNVAGA